jgi:hypothetical protein
MLQTKSYTSNDANNETQATGVDDIQADTDQDVAEALDMHGRIPGVDDYQARPTENQEGSVDDDEMGHINDFDDRYGPRTSVHNLKPRRPRDYSHLHTILEDTVMTQMLMKRGIKEFGNDGIDAVLLEFKQLHDRDVVEPHLASSLTIEERRGALPYLMFLKKSAMGLSEVKDVQMAASSDCTLLRKTPAHRLWQ